MRYSPKQILLCLPCLLLPALLCACGSPYKKSSLIEANGQVEVQRANESFLLGADAGFRFKEGDAVTSQSDGSAWFWLDGYKSILLGPNSKLRMAHYGRGFNLGLDAGFLFVRIDKALGASEVFEVATGQVVLSVRGTVFSAQYQSAGEVLLNVFQGRVALCEATGAELITAEKGQSLSYDPATGKLIQPAAPIDYGALPALVAACVTDYKTEAEAGSSPASQGQSGPAASPPAASEVGSAAGSAASAQSGAAGGASAPAASPAPATATPAVFYSVVFDLNGGAIGPVSQAILREVQPGRAAEPPGVPERAGYMFAGWFLEPEGRTPAGLSGIEKSFTVYAGWAPAPSPTPAQSRPAVRFKYLWDKTEFRPAADIAWAAPGGGFFTWQICDAAGRAAAESGTIGAGNSALALTDQIFAASAPQNGLYPKGYTLQLTACSSAGTALWPAFVMELPYFELSEETRSGERFPVVSTNVGLYFDHSLQNVPVTWAEDHFEAAGTLYSLQGESAPLALAARSSG